MTNGNGAPERPANDLRPDMKSFRGSYLLYRQRGKGMERVSGSTLPRFRHPTRESAETEASRLLTLHPQSTFLILQEVGRVKIKAADRG